MNLDRGFQVRDPMQQKPPVSSDNEHRTIGGIILRFMGVGGWLLFPILLLENRVAVTFNGSNWALDALMFLTVILWLVTRLETMLRDWWDSK